MIVRFKSKIKVWATIICCVLIGLAGTIYGLINIHSIMVRTINTSTIIIVIYICVIRIKPQFSQIIRVQEDSIIFVNCYDKFHRPPMDVKMKYKEIVRLAYCGTRFFPISESLIVETSDERIYIDFNFKDYKMIWKDVYLKCHNENPKIKVDNGLLKRISKE